MSSGPGVTGIRFVLVAAGDDRDAHGADLLPRRLRLQRQVGRRPVPGRRLPRIHGAVVVRVDAELRLQVDDVAHDRGARLHGRQQACVCSVFVASVDRIERLPEARRLARRRRLPEVDERGQ